ncbi:hypothetical protein Tco_1264678 [Tanacetum coccineum]
MKTSINNQNHTKIIISFYKYITIQYSEKRGAKVVVVCDCGGDGGDEVVVAMVCGGWWWREVGVVGVVVVVTAYGGDGVDVVVGWDVFLAVDGGDEGGVGALRCGGGGLAGISPKRRRKIREERGG